MRAAIFDAPQAIRMADVAKPAPGRGEVLVQVKAAGLCAGDLYIYTGKNPYVSYPRIGCHEIAGVGRSIRARCDCRPAIGTRVVVDPFIGCGTVLSLPHRQAQLLRQSRPSSAFIARAVRRLCRRAGVRTSTSCRTASPTSRRPLQSRWRSACRAAAAAR